jgi:hypothetical protein
MIIQPDQIKYHTMSLTDTSGRLFSWNGELYRAISTEITPLYRRLFEDGTISRLVDHKLLVDTEQTAFEVQGSGMVLRHRRLPFVSYPYEWSAGMLKAAALKTLDLEIELSARGLTLQDAHPWNVVFDGTEPQFVDFGSIVPRPSTWSSPEAWPAHEMFRRFFLHPLILMSEGHDHIARWLLFEGERGISGDDMAALTGRHDRAIHLRQRLRALAGKVVPARAEEWVRRRLEAHRKALARTLDRMSGNPHSPHTLRAQVEATPIPESDSEQTGMGWSEPPQWSRPRREALEAFLKRHSPRSVLHTGADPGERAQLTAAGGTPTAALLRRPERVEALYENARARRLDLLPLIADFRKPWPAYGIGECFALPVERRLNCDAVVAFDLPSHLAVEHRISFDETARMLGELSRQWLLVDFVPPGDPSLPGQRGAPPWYALDRFKAALGSHFRTIETLDATSEHPILICEKPAGAQPPKTNQGGAHVG